MIPTRFESLHDLARLPFFEVRDDRLVLADPSLGPAIDLHTHLALTYLVPPRVDLQALHPETEHYLPKHRSIDLEVYINRNFQPEDLERLTRDLTTGSLGTGGMRRTHTIANLGREMRELGIRRSVLLPIDFPVLSDNAGHWLEQSRGHDDMLCFGSVHPYRPGMRKNLERQVKLGARGIKVHPAVQMVRPDDARAMKLYRLCGEKRLPVLFHCGPVDIETRLGRYLSQVRLYERAIAECPETTFLLGHSGALQMPEALAFARKYPNVVLELSSQSLSSVRRILAEAPPERIVFGSDWPFYHQAIGLAKVFLATDDAAERGRVLWGNAARLFGIEG
jgi:predicted TIM-barrel fold metal-dependent hydrolase